MAKLKELFEAHLFIGSKAYSLGGAQRVVYSYGTPGLLLRKNLLQQWWKYMVSGQENTFPVEAAVVSPRSPEASYHLVANSGGDDQSRDISMKSTLSQDLLSHYLHNLEFINNRLPFSQAAVGTCFHDKLDQHQHGTGSPLARGLYLTHMIHQYYSPPANIAQTWHHWTQYRLRWWKQFSRKPSNFVTSTKDNISFIEYEFPWGKDTLETICNLGDHSIRELEANSGSYHQGKPKRKSVYPHVIESQTTLEAAMLAFLYDAYQEKDVYSIHKNSKQNGSTRIVLQLHVHLAPYSVAMVMTGSKWRELRHVTSQWTRELRAADVTVLDTADVSLTQEAQFRRNDELGVHYTAILNDQTLETGMVSVRHRDTILREHIHITKLKDRLLRYTQPV